MPDLPGPNAMRDAQRQNTGVFDWTPAMKSAAMKDAARVCTLSEFVGLVKSASEKTDPGDLEANAKLVRMLYNRACELIQTRVSL